MFGRLAGFLYRHGRSVLLVAVIVDSFLNPHNEETAQQGDI